MNYKKAYYLLFSAITDATADLLPYRDNIIIDNILDILCLAQQKTEKMFIESEKKGE